MQNMNMFIYNKLITPVRYSSTWTLMNTAPVHSANPVGTISIGYHQRRPRSIQLHEGSRPCWMHSAYYKLWHQGRLTKILLPARTSFLNKHKELITAFWCKWEFAAPLSELLVRACASASDMFRYPMRDDQTLGVAIRTSTWTTS
jgi:hypothetical protein